MGDGPRHRGGDRCLPPRALPAAARGGRARRRPNCTTATRRTGSASPSTTASPATTGVPRRSRGWSTLSASPTWSATCSSPPSCRSSTSATGGRGLPAGRRLPARLPPAARCRSCCATSAPGRATSCSRWVPRAPCAATGSPWSATTACPSRSPRGGVRVDDRIAAFLLGSGVADGRLAGVLSEAGPGAPAIDDLVAPDEHLARVRRLAGWLRERDHGRPAALLLSGPYGSGRMATAAALAAAAEVDLLVADVPTGTGLAARLAHVRGARLPRGAAALGRPAVARVRAAARAPARGRAGRSRCRDAPVGRPARGDRGCPRRHAAVDRVLAGAGRAAARRRRRAPRAASAVVRAAPAPVAGRAGCRAPRSPRPRGAGRRAGQRVPAHGRADRRRGGDGPAASRSPASRRGAVRRIPAQRDEVRHLLGLDAVALAHAGDVHEFGPALGADLGNSTATSLLTHWNMSRSPVNSSAVPPASTSVCARLPRRSSASRSPALSTDHPNAPKKAGVWSHCHASSGGIGGRSAW